MCMPTLLTESICCAGQSLRPSYYWFHQLNPPKLLVLSLHNVHGIWVLNSMVPRLWLPFLGSISGPHFLQFWANMFPWLLHPKMPVPRVFARNHSLFSWVCNFLELHLSYTKGTNMIRQWQHTGNYFQDKFKAHGPNDIKDILHFASNIAPRVITKMHVHTYKHTFYIKV